MMLVNRRRAAYSLQSRSSCWAFSNRRLPTTRRTSISFFARPRRDHWICRPLTAQLHRLASISAPTLELLVHERRVVVYIQTSQRQRHQLLQLPQGLAHQQAVAPGERDTFAPTTGHIGNISVDRKGAPWSTAVGGTHFFLEPAVSPAAAISGELIQSPGDHGAQEPPP